jgi:Tfp pilus assembly protein PilF
MYEEAIASFKQAIGIDPNSASAHHQLGLTYLFSNDGGSASEQYKILTTLDSEKANDLSNYISKQ